MIEGEITYLIEWNLIQNGSFQVLFSYHILLDSHHPENYEQLIFMELVLLQ